MSSWKRLARPGRWMWWPCSWPRRRPPSRSPFCAYMRTEWHAKPAVRVPSTNNALESFNGRIKRQATLRKNLSLTTFLDVSGRALMMRSKDTQFETAVDVPLSVWRDAYVWAKQNVQLKDVNELVIAPVTVPSSRRMRK